MGRVDVAKLTNNDEGRLQQQRLDLARVVYLSALRNSTVLATE